MTSKGDQKRAILDGGEGWRWTKEHMGCGRRKETQKGAYKEETGVAGNRVDWRRITSCRLFDNVLIASIML